MRKTLRGFLLAVLMVLALAAEAGAEAALWIAVDQAPVRIWRTAQAEVLLRLPRGAVVNPLHAQGSWTKVREPGGQEGWVYQGHLSATPLPPALGSLFDAPPGSIILAEAADTSRSNRSHAPARAEGNEALWTALDLRSTPEDLEDFLRQGGIGEFSRARPQSRGGQASFPALRPAAPPGGEAERQVGLNLAARVVNRLASPDFGVARTRYVNMVGLAVARHAPGQTRHFRVVVLDLPEPLSFSLPGGIVMLSTGLLSALENEAQLALILAHEVAHSALGHLWAGTAGTQFFRDGGKVDAVGVRTPAFAAMLDELLHTALTRGLDRNMEFDADVAAVQMAYGAGYDPQQLSRAILRIEESGRPFRRQGPPEVWAALHPPTAERLERLRSLLARLPVQDGLALATERFRANR